MGKNWDRGCVNIKRRAVEERGSSASLCDSGKGKQLPWIEYGILLFVYLFPRSFSSNSELKTREEQKECELSQEMSHPTIKEPWLNPVRNDRQHAKQ